MVTVSKKTMVVRCMLTGWTNWLMTNEGVITSDVEALMCVT